MSSDDVFGSFEKHEEITGEDSEVNAIYLAEESSFTRDVLKKLSCSDELGSNFIDDADKAYIILLNVFRYLPRRDLLSAARVCKVWNLVGSDGIFWKRISLNNLVISDVDMMVRNMKKYGTQVLDLRGMSFLMRENGNQRVSGYNSILQAMITFLEWPEKWLSLYKALAEIPTLTELTMEEYPQEAVTLLAKGLPQLKSLSAYHSSEDFFDLAPLRNMKELQTVKLINNKSTRLDFDENSTEPTDDIDLKLTTLTITRAINLSHIEHILPSTLVSLALGECDSLSDNFFKVVLRRLVNLNKLRLELCRNENQVNMLLESISKLPNLSEFELINFEVGNGFLTTINKCTNLKSLLLIPKYKFNSQHLNPLINYIILRGLSTLKNNLKVCVWVVSDINFKTSAKNLPILMTSHGFIPVYLPRVKKVHNCPLDKIVFAESPGLNFKIFRTNFSSTWMISLQNIKM